MLIRVRRNTTEKLMDNVDFIHAKPVFSSIKHTQLSFRLLAEASQLKDK